MPEPTFKPTPLEEILAPDPGHAKKKVEWRGRSGEPMPLWAILGDEPPYDWQPPAQSAIPEPSGATSGPEITVTGHPVLGFGPTHTAIQYTTPDGQVEWISAGPDWGRLRSGVGALDQNEDPIGERPRDEPRENTFMGHITPPQSMSAADYWQRLKTMDARYGDNVDYDLFPEIQDSYNSNSYTRGLLEASGGTSTVPYDELVGGASPLPPQHFPAPHLRENGIADSWKPPRPVFFRRRF
jgi:hypothetical protein